MPNITRLTANMILWAMTGVWCYLSVKEGLMQPVSENFLYIGGLILFGEGSAAMGLPGKLGKKIGG